MTHLKDKGLERIDFLFCVNCFQVFVAKFVDSLIPKCQIFGGLLADFFEWK